MPTPGKLGVRPIEEQEGIILPKVIDYVDRSILPVPAGDPFSWIAPNTTFDGTSGVAQLGMLGNDVWGDCVFAGWGHTVMLNAWLGGIQPVGNYNNYAVWPTDDAFITAYLAYNGSPDPTNHNFEQQQQYDNGADPTEALLWLQANPMPLSDGTLLGPWDFADVADFGEEFEGAMQNFGVLYNAINVSQEAMAQFQADQPFTSTSTNFIGGHLFPTSYRDPHIGKGPTWSVEWEFSWPWWRVSRVSSMIILTREITSSITFFNAAALQGDINKLGVQVGIEPGKPAPSAVKYVKKWW